MSGAVRTRNANRHNATLREAILDLLRKDPTRDWESRDIHQKVMRLGTFESVKRQIEHLKGMGLIEAATKTELRGYALTWKIVAERKTG